MSKNYRKQKNPKPKQTIPTLKNAAECQNWLQRDQERSCKIRRFDVWYAYLQKVSYGGSINKARPVLVISNDTFSRKANTVTVLPLTSNSDRANFPCNEKLENVGDKYSESAVLCDQILTIDKHQLNRKITHINDKKTKQKIETALLKYLGMADTQCELLGN